MHELDDLAVAQVGTEEPESLVGDPAMLKDEVVGNREEQALEVAVAIGGLPVREAAILSSSHPAARRPLQCWEYTNTLPTR